MMFDDFEIQSFPAIKATCKECEEPLMEIPHGFISVDFYCDKCETVYQLKLTKVSAKKVDWDGLREYLKRR